MCKRLFFLAFGLCSVFVNDSAFAGLVGWWKFDEGSGIVSADSSGFGYDGKLNGMDDSDLVDGIMGKALEFDGVDDYVTIPPLDLAGTNTLTITAWIKREGQQSIYTGIVWSRDTNTQAGTGICFGSGPGFRANHELAYCWDESFWEWHSRLIVPDGKWVFVALVVEPTKATLYMGQDGALSSATHEARHDIITEFNGVSMIGYDNYRLKGASDIPHKPFKGMIDEVRIYNHGLDADEIGAIYAYVEGFDKPGEAETAKCPDKVLQETHRAQQRVRHWGADPAARTEQADKTAGALLAIAKAREAKNVSSEEVLEDYYELIASFPDSAEAIEAKMLVALSLMLEGGTQDAINLLTEIIQKYPEGKPAARSKFLIGYLEVSEQKYSEALETFRELVEQFPASRYVEESQRFIERLTERQICNLRRRPNGRESLLSAQQAEGADRPNVLLIGIETLRADHVGCLGYFRDTTPTLDKLGKEGVVFSRAVATSSWTIPAVMSVFTSLYPGVHRTTDYRKKLPEKTGTLAEVLKKNGFMTAAFVSSTVLDSRYGFSRGFDLYDDFSVQLALGLDLFGKNETAEQGIFSGAPTSEPLNRAAISWLRKNHHKPFFMFVFYFDPHSDYVPPAPFDTVFEAAYEGSIDGHGIAFEPKRSTCPPKRDLDHLMALYDGEILYTDGYISELLEKFEEYGILDRTLVVVFGDHGEQFYEHGSASHGWTLYNEVIDVPLIFRWPSMAAKGTTVSAIVSQVDVMPTILDYLDIEYDGFVQGSSLRPAIEGQKDKLHEVVYAELNVEGNKVFSAAIGKDHKFILDLNNGGKELFDLSRDSRERENVYPARILRGPAPLEGRLIRYLADNERLAAQLCGAEDSQKVELDEAHIRRLKALGYLR